MNDDLNAARWIVRGLIGGALIYVIFGIAFYIGYNI